MTQEQTKDKAQGQKMIEWFKDKAPPEQDRIEFHPGQVIMDYKKFIETQVATLNANIPLSNPWLAAYHRLYRLKKKISK